MQAPNAPAPRAGAATSVLAGVLVAACALEAWLTPSTMDQLERGWPAAVPPWSIGAVLLVATIPILRRLRAPRSLVHLFLGLGVLLVGATLSAALPSRPSYGMGPALLRYAPLVGACALGLWARKRPEVLARGVLIAALFLAATVILDAEGLWPRMELARRPGGLLGNRNFAGEYLAIAAGVCLAVVTDETRWILLPIGAALAFTRCRSAWIAVAVAAVLLIVFAPRPRRRGLGIAAALLVAGGLVAVILPNRLSWTEESPYLKSLQTLGELDAGSGRLRVRQYQETIGSLRGTWLLGHGAGRWRPAVMLRDPTVAKARVPHSDVLRALSDGGVIACGGLFLLLAAALAGAWRRRTEHPERLASVAALAAVTLADAPLYRPESAMLAALLLVAAADSDIADGG